MRDLETCQHEAAHVVVGIALGLRLRKAVVNNGTRAWYSSGWAWFTNHGSDLAHAIMFAAGTAWDREMGEDCPEDSKNCLERLKKDPSDPTGHAELRTCIRIARQMLRDLSVAHSMVTKALLEKDLTSKDIAAIARGEKVADE